MESSVDITDLELALGADEREAAAPELEPEPAPQAAPPPSLPGDQADAPLWHSPWTKELYRKAGYLCVYMVVVTAVAVLFNRLKNPSPEEERVAEIAVVLTTLINVLALTEIFWYPWKFTLGKSAFSTFVMRALQIILVIISLAAQNSLQGRAIFHGVGFSVCIALPLLLCYRMNKSARPILWVVCLPWVIFQFVGMPMLQDAPLLQNGVTVSFLLFASLVGFSDSKGRFVHRDTGYAAYVGLSLWAFPLVLKWVFCQNLCTKTASGLTLLALAHFLFDGLLYCNLLEFGRRAATQRQLTVLYLLPVDFVNGVFNELLFMNVNVTVWQFYFHLVTQGLLLFIKDSGAFAVAYHRVRLRLIQFLHRKNKVQRNYMELVEANMDLRIGFMACEQHSQLEWLVRLVVLTVFLMEYACHGALGSPSVTVGMRDDDRASAIYGILISLGALAAIEHLAQRQRKRFARKRLFQPPRTLLQRLSSVRRSSSMLIRSFSSSSSGKASDTPKAAAPQPRAPASTPRGDGPSTGGDALMVVSKAKMYMRERHDKGCIEQATASMSAKVLWLKHSRFLVATLAFFTYFCVESIMEIRILAA